MKKIVITLSFLLLGIFLFANRDSTGVGLSYDRLTHNPYFIKVNSTSIGFGKRLTFPGATITANGDSINVDLNGVYWKQNGNSFGTESDIGSNDAFGINLETNGTRRLRFSSGGRIFGSPTDFVISASDSATWYGSGLTILGNSASNTFLNGLGFVGVFQGNSSYGALGSSVFTAGATASFDSDDGTTVSSDNFVTINGADSVTIDAGNQIYIESQDVDAIILGDVDVTVGDDLNISIQDAAVISAGDSLRVGTTNNRLSFSPTFTRWYGINGTAIAYQVNNSTLAHAINVADNATTAYVAQTRFGAKPFINFKSTDGAHQLNLGTDTTGARLYFGGYGKGVKEAGDLSKTFSGYIPGFATDSATVLDVKLWEQFEVDTVNATETISVFSARTVTLILDAADGNVTCVFPAASAALAGVKVEAVRIDASVNIVSLDPSGANNFWVANGAQNDYTLLLSAEAQFRCASIGGTYYWVLVSND